MGDAELIPKPLHPNTHPSDVGTGLLGLIGGHTRQTTLVCNDDVISS